LNETKSYDSVVRWTAFVLRTSAASDFERYLTWTFVFPWLCLMLDIVFTLNRVAPAKFRAVRCIAQRGKDLRFAVGGSQCSSYSQEVCKFRCALTTKVLTGTIMLACLAGCVDDVTALEREKLRLLSCDFTSADTPTKREALAWHAELARSPDHGKAALAGPFWLNGACLEQVEVGLEGTAGHVCNDKPATFSAAMSSAGVALIGGDAAKEKQALFFIRSKYHVYVLVEGVFGAFLAVTPQPGTYSFVCAVGSKKKRH
jgi:hypothetical protein